MSDEPDFVWGGATGHDDHYNPGEIKMGGFRNWHPPHAPRFSMSSHYDEVCDACGATDATSNAFKREAPCGMPDKAEFDHLRTVVSKEDLYKLLYNHYSHRDKWMMFLKIIANISYKPGWYFRTGFENDRMWVQVGITEEAEIYFDPIEKKKVPWRGAKHFLSPFMCRNEIVSCVKHAIDRSEMHEVNEWFRYKGASIFNPHLDPDALVEVAKYIKNFDTRDNAMTMEEPK